MLSARYSAMLQTLKYIPISNQAFAIFWPSRCLNILYLFAFHVCFVLCQNESLKASEWLEQIVPQNYVSFSSPCDQLYHGNSSRPTFIVLSLTPDSLMSVEPKTMDFVVDIRIYIRWIDERLIIPRERLDSNSYLVDIPKHIASKLWAPYIKLSNCKRCKQELIDTEKQRLRLYSRRKSIYVIVATTYTLTCDIDLTNYPFDRQYCPIIIKKCEPYGECIKYVFHLHRQYTHHLMLVFIPSMLIVILSWISFWLDPDVAAPRVALGLTSLLTLATQFNNAQKDLPPVATVKALDIWMFACMIIVFSSLVEFAICNYWNSRRYRAKVKPEVIRVRQIGKAQRKGSLRRRFRTPSPGNQNIYPQDLPKKTSCIDLFARIAFPAAFICFNAFYWFYFTHEERH